MKDSVARMMAIEAKTDMAQRFAVLKAAHDELFDFLAGELGFQAQSGYSYPDWKIVKFSPRRLATLQAPPRVLRTKGKK